MPLSVLKLIVNLDVIISILYVFNQAADKFIPSSIFLYWILWMVEFLHFSLFSKNVPHRPAIYTEIFLRLVNLSLKDVFFCTEYFEWLNSSTFHHFQKISLICNRNSGVGKFLFSVIPVSSKMPNYHTLLWSQM